MYDAKKMIFMGGIYDGKITVGRLVEQLSKLPQDAELTICGDSYVYIHVEKDGSAVNIDCEDLDEEYAYDEFTSSEDYFKAFGGEKNG